jgi:hypothetical protein
VNPGHRAEAKCRRYSANSGGADRTSGGFAGSAPPGKLERSQHRVSVSYLRSHAPQQHTEATVIEESGFA